MPDSIIITGGEISKVVNDKKYNKKYRRKSLKSYKKDKKDKKNSRSGKNFKYFKYRVMFFLIVILAASLCIFKYSELAIRPIILSMAEAHAKSIGARVIGETINEEMTVGNISYDDLVAFEKDGSGKITALKTNIILVNQLKSQLSLVILNKLSDMNDINLYLPVGNLLNNEFLAGRGPEIEIIVLPVGTVTTNISNIFTSAGINQTRHQIIFDVRVTVSIIMPFSVESTDISMSVTIAETIIVGDVPNMYMESGSGGEKIPPLT